jgi:hypothetical protein
MYLHHECPVVVLSPEDSHAHVAGVENRYGGKRAYIGQDSLDRQRRHLEILLEFPETHFMIHDSDSVCLDPKFPDYLYNDPDVVWSNQVDDAIPEHQDTFLEGWPHVAFQPPYFLSRSTIADMLLVADDPRCVASPVMPFIDYYMVQLTMCAGLRWARFLDSISCPIAHDPISKPVLSDRDAATYANGFKIAMQAVRSGGSNILHSVKNPVAVQQLVEARRLWLEENPHSLPRPTPAPRVRGGA